jgi:RHS repeat-associated protein
VVTLEEYTYDVAGRLLGVHHRVYGQPPVHLLQNRYNEIGQLIKKSFHGQNGSFWQKRDYEYNIRGWLTKVNGGTETESLFDDMYSFELAYNQPLAGMGNTLQYNGNITAYAETRPFEQENAQAVKSGYAYGYDAADRLKQAAYVRLSDAAMNGAYNEGQSYDANGNITTLTRKGMGETSQQLIDQLAYTYHGNQLQKVDDTANAQAGFRDIGNTTDYAYDANGNLTRDGNKNITSIHYNLLDLPDSVTFSDGRALAIGYSAAGEKLQQVVYRADLSVKEKYNYVKGFLYRNDSLKLIQHDEGRVVYTGGQWVYDYHLKDHLGNVRCTFTTGGEAETFMATLEENNAGEEEAVFGESYRQAVVVNTEVFNHTAKGSRSLRLNGATEKEITGLAKSLQVLPGDRVSLAVYAKYVASRGKETDASQFMMAVLSSAFGLSPGAPGEAGLAYESFAALDKAGLLIHTGKGVNNQAPKAYLNYILFDKDFIPYDLGFEQVDAAAREDGSGVAHDQLALDVSVTRPGYLYVYLSNESATVTDVYFDDLTIVHIPSPIIETATYYPYGLIATQHTRENTTAQRMKYNGKELISEEGLDWHDFGARMYDAALGRWHVIDPLADQYAAYAPYHYALDNPVKFVDPDGKNAELVIDEKNKTATLQANYYVHPENMDLALEAMSVWTGMSGEHKIKVGNEEYTLNFAMQVISVKGGTLEHAAQGDPIGNTISVTSKTIVDSKNVVLRGKTRDEDKITVHQSVSALELAHEMGHTLLALAGDDSEHISKTIMNDGQNNVKRKINGDFVKKIRQTYGLEKNPMPPWQVEYRTKTTGEVVIIRHGEEYFRKVYQPRISDEQLRKYFQSFQYEMKQ